ncbi:MAG: VCBS repeat-containing protein [Planctomycetes bacterium]|nr:VCBS repeat-containing protein [Planctomycetota bacterium]MBI3843558.1 VCBS repeat-containing protein [Planctomycetota bacterium]
MRNDSWIQVTVAACAMTLGARALAGGCSNSGELQLSVPVLDVGRAYAIGIQGPPSARYAVVGSRFTNATRTRAGTWCIDLGRRYVLLRDSIRGTDPPLDANGQASIPIVVPQASRFLGLNAHFQGVGRDVRRGAWVLSELESRVVGNGSVGDFTQEMFFLPNEAGIQGSTSCTHFFDCDGDGDLDLVLGSWPRPRLFINDGTGHFTDGTDGPVTGLPPRGLWVQQVASGDVDGDGDLDLYFADACCGDVSLGYDGQDRLYLNDGHGFFTDATLGTDAGLPHVGYENTNDQTYDVKFADLDGDGDLDVFLAQNSYGLGRVLINVNGRGFFVDANENPGTFFPRAPNGGEVRTVAIGDVDGDGDPDLAMFGLYVARLYRNDRHAVFTDVTNDATAGLPDLTNVLGADAKFADLDGDGDLDIAIAVDGGFTQFQDRILFNNGHGRFADGTFGEGTGLPPVLDISLRVLTGDVDRDGDVDLIFPVRSYAAGDMCRLYLNDGHGRFVDSTFGPVSRLPGIPELNWAGDLGDVDGDGDLDLILTRDLYPNGLLPITIYFNH